MILVILIIFALSSLFPGFRKLYLKPYFQVYLLTNIVDMQLYIVISVFFGSEIYLCFQYLSTFTLMCSVLGSCICFSEKIHILDKILYLHMCVLLEEGMATHSSILTWRIPIDRGTWWVTAHGVTKSQT